MDHIHKITRLAPVTVITVALSYILRSIGENSSPFSVMGFGGLAFILATVGYALSDSKLNPYRTSIAWHLMLMIFIAAWSDTEYAIRNFSIDILAAFASGIIHFTVLAKHYSVSPKVFTSFLIRDLIFMLGLQDRAMGILIILGLVNIPEVTVEDYEALAEESEQL